MEEMEEATPTEPTPGDVSELSPEEGRNVLRTVGIVVAVLVVFTVVLAILYGLVSYPDLTSVLRDISIIVLALVTIVTGIFLIVLIFQLQTLIALLRDEIYPILDSVNQTANTVRGTTTFVSDAVVTPVINAASYASAVRQTLRVLTGSPSRRKRPSPSPEQE